MSIASLHHPHNQVDWLMLPAAQVQQQPDLAEVCPWQRCQQPSSTAQQFERTRLLAKGELRPQLWLLNKPQ